MTPILQPLDGCDIARGAAWNLPGDTDLLLTGYTVRLTLSACAPAFRPVATLDNGGNGGITVTVGETGSSFVIALTAAQTAALPNVDTLYYWLTLVQPDSAPLAALYGHIPCQTWTGGAEVSP
jgi:hypothetical protein